MTAEQETIRLRYIARLLKAGASVDDIPTDITARTGEIDQAFLAFRTLPNTTHRTILRNAILRHARRISA